jgi:nitroimidazol reductase NimA-like FMN-containing flavoprotein (pyridoxamine 5'-phosphate oxidase superfamily)
VTNPTTTLNEAFSEPGARPTRWEDAVALLTSAELFWIGTVRRDGRPHMTPLVSVWLDDALHFCTGEREQKAANLRSNQHVILMTGCNQWNQGMDVVVEGEAVAVTDPTMLARLAEAWAQKWNGGWDYEPGEGGFVGEGLILVFTVRPEKVFAFAKGKFSHTRHLFERD